MTIHEQIEILQAYERGEEIEICGKNTLCDKWFIVRPDHQFDFAHNRYRIKPKRWRAEKGDSYYYINYDLCVKEEMECSEESDGSCYEVGNYFRTQVDAEKARELLKECLIKFHEKND